MIWVLLGFVVIVFLLIASAFFSSSETAIVSLNRARVRERAEKGVMGAAIAENLLKKPDKFLSAILIANNLVNILASVTAGAIAMNILGNIGIAIATFFMVLIVLMFCEITPKTFAMGNEKFAFKVAKSIQILTKILNPLVVFFTSISNSLNKTFGKEKSGSVVTEGEIKTLLKMGVEEGTIEKDEKEMIHEVFDFGDTPVKEIMVPREKMVCMPEGATIGELLEVFDRTGFSRIPVHNGSLDDMRGMIYVKDLLKLDDKNLPIRKAMRPVLKVRDVTKADDALRKMQKEKTQLAIVQDLNGRTIGLVTAEDLIEEIVGEISDEADEKSPNHD